MIEKKQLKQAVDLVLKAAGFEKNGASWYLDSPEIVGVLNLQKHDFSDKYFVNISFLIRSLSAGDERPLHNRCHIQTRVESVFPQDYEKLERIFKLDGDLDAKVQVDEVVAFFEQRVIPFVKSLRDVQRIREQSSAKWFENSLVYKEVNALFQG